MITPIQHIKIDNADLPTPTTGHDAEVSATTSGDIISDVGATTPHIVVWADQAMLPPDTWIPSSTVLEEDTLTETQLPPDCRPEADTTGRKILLEECKCGDEGRFCIATQCKCKKEGYGRCNQYCKCACNKRDRGNDG